MKQNQLATFSALPEDNGLKARYEKYRSLLKEFTLMNDVLMRNVFKERACTEYVLQIIMGKKDLKVKNQVIQQDYKNLQGRSAILDCVAMDAEGRYYNIEIQQDNEGASPKRARYYSALMDMNTLEAGEAYEKLPESYVIFITRNDVLGHGQALYHIERKLDEVPEVFGDGSYILYVNSGIQNETELGRLMHDLHCKRAEEMYSVVLAKRMSMLKERAEGVESMCKEMEKIYQEGFVLGETRGAKQGFEWGAKQGFERGMLEAKREHALSMAKIGLTVRQIAEVVKVEESVVEKWLADSLSAIQ